MKTVQRQQQRHLKMVIDVVPVYFYCLLLTLNRFQTLNSNIDAYIVNFKQVNADWVVTMIT